MSIQQETNNCNRIDQRILELGVIIAGDALLQLQDYCNRFAEWVVKKVICIDEVGVNNNFKIYRGMCYKEILLFEIEEFEFNSDYFLIHFISLITGLPRRGKRQFIFFQIMLYTI